MAFSAFSFPEWWWSVTSDEQWGGMCLLNKIHFLFLDESFGFALAPRVKLVAESCPVVITSTKRYSCVSRWIFKNRTCNRSCLRYIGMTMELHSYVWHRGLIPCTKTCYTWPKIFLVRRETRRVRSHWYRWISIHPKRGISDQWTFVIPLVRLCSLSSQYIPVGSLRRNSTPVGVILVLLSHKLSNFQVHS